MSQVNAMKQIGTRNMGFRVELMKWSNKMDLIAIGNEKGEILIQRLNWQKICTFPSPGENIKVKAISWQPDETIIAAAYSNGKVALLDVEKDDEIYSFELESEIKTLHWTKPVSSSSSLDSSEIYDQKYDPSNENYLPPLPNLSTLSSAARKSNVIFSKGSPSFLVVSLSTGKICLSVLGVLPCGSIDIKEYIQNINDYDIYDVRMGSSLNEIIVYIRDGSKMNVLIFNNNILSKHISSLLTLANKHGHILETLNYINETIQCIIEAWETVLIEMDNKLIKYTNSQPEGSMAADFLELLMFGVPSQELETFLTRELTEKGIKKLGTSIELTYSTIQNLVVKPLHSAGINLFYHLNILKGLSQNTYFYKDLITKDCTENAIINAGSFLLKILEVQQTIDQSATDYKIFWCWLSVVIVRLMDEAITDDVAAVTQEDITYLAEFLNNFDECIYEKEDGTKVKRKFNLERVGQYLKNSKINFPQKSDNTHMWNKLLSENECLRKSSLIFPHHNEYSLIQEHNLLKDTIRQVFAKPEKSISEAFNLKCKINCGDLVEPEKFINTSYFVNKVNNSDLLVILLNDKEILFIESNILANTIKSLKLNLFVSPFMSAKRLKLFEEIHLTDLQFYNESILSLLLQGITEDGKIINYFVQLPIDSIKEQLLCYTVANEIDLSNTKKFNILDILDVNYFKPVEGNCTAIAVSGSRKVASVLSDGTRKIRVYEMEIEDDDDEVEMSQNPILDNSKDSTISQD